MARIYGEIQSSALMTFDKSFARSNGQPLDPTEVYYSKSAAEDYAKTDVAYVGQKIAVIENIDGVNKLTHYGIEPDNSLKELGASPVGDETTIVVSSDGTISLAGIEGLTFIEKNESGEDVSVTYQPLMTSAGLTWVKPSATTVEGLAAEIESLRTKMASLETTIGDSDEGLVKDVDDLKNELNILTGDDTTTGSVKKAVKDAVAEANEYTDEKVALLMNNSSEAVDSVMELAETMENNKEAIDALVEIAGGKATKEELNGVVERVDSLEDGLDTTQSDVENLKEKSHEHDNIDLLDTLTTEKIAAWDNKVDKNGTDRLITEEEAEKLAGVAEGAEVNKIDDVSEEFTISEQRTLSITSVSQNKIVGLPEALAKKVDKVDGKQLSTEDFTTELKTKLENLDGNANENVIETIKIDNVTQDIVNKTFNIPGATLTALGLVKGSDVENKVKVNNDFTMEVHSLNVNKLVQTDGEILILDGGSAAT